MGGMRAAAALSGVAVEIVAAFEISQICERVYRHNYAEARWRRQTIERLPAEELDSLAADVWLMSPPCQPFTRSGNRLDHEPPRSPPPRRSGPPPRACRPCRRRTP